MYTYIHTHIYNTMCNNNTSKSIHMYPPRRLGANLQEQMWDRIFDAVMMDAGRAALAAGGRHGGLAACSSPDYLRLLRPSRVWVSGSSLCLGDFHPLRIRV